MLRRIVSPVAQRLRAALGRAPRAREPLRVLDLWPGPGAPRGRALLSYLPQGLVSAGAVERARAHSNVWESAEIGRILLRLGFAVDAVGWDDAGFTPRHEYDVVVDLHRSLTRYATPRSRAVLHVTGSHPRFSNRAEQARLDALRERRGVALRPRRSFSTADLDAFDASLARADLATMVGDASTAATFPAEVRSKIRLVPVTASLLTHRRDVERATFGPEFLWFGGLGAVHKGLDLLLEVFARRPDLTLHVVGPYQREDDFVEAYRRELQLPNVRSHGWLEPSSGAFRRLAERVSAFVLPSCSEATSTAAVTCMQYGILPVVSDRCGIDVAAARGLLLRELGVEAVAEAVQRVCELDRDTLRASTAAAQRYAVEAFSREAFTAGMTAALQGL